MYKKFNNIDFEIFKDYVIKNIDNDWSHSKCEKFSKNNSFTNTDKKIEENLEALKLLEKLKSNLNEVLELLDALKELHYEDEISIKIIEQIKELLR